MNAKMRVISLAPTQTEIIASLGCFKYLVGVTENCDYPAPARKLPTYGSWYAPDINAVMYVRPDLVCSFGKHQQEIAETLTEAGLRVYHSDPDTVSSSLATIRDLAGIMGCAQAGAVLLEGLEKRLETVKRNVAKLDPLEYPSVLRIMNWDPLITVGSGAFQHDVIELAGGRNVMADGPAPYFACEPSQVFKRNPDVVYFCEPFILNLMEDDPQWREVKALRNKRYFLFDCGLACRSGPRIVDMVEQLAKAIHPKVW